MYLKIHVYLWALCGFNLMLCVISRWSPNLDSVIFVIMESNLGQCPFTLGDMFFPIAHGGKMFLDCVWLRPLPMGPKDHVQKRSYLSLLPTTHRGREKPWGYGWGPAHGAKRLHTRDDNIMLVVNGWISWPVYAVV